MKKFVINFFASLFATIILFGLLLFICLITPISLVVMVIYIKLFLILIFCWLFYIIYKGPPDINEFFNKDDTDKSNLTLKKGKWKK